MLLLPDDILNAIIDAQRQDPNIVSADTPAVKPKRKLGAKFIENLIKRENKLLGNYTKKYYVNLFEDYFKAYQKQWDRINEVILGADFFNPPKKSIIPDLSEFFENLYSDVEEKLNELKEKVKNKILGWIKSILKKVWNGIKSAIKKGLKKIWNAIKRLCRALKKRANRRGSLYRKAKALFKKLMKKFQRIYKKNIVPAIRKFFAFLKKRLKNIIKICKTAFKPLKKIIKKFLNFITKVIRSAITKAVKKVVMIIVKQAIKWGLRAIATAISATGVGAIIGAAIWALTVAMDVYEVAEMAYDVYDTFSGEEEYDDGEEGEQIENQEDPLKEATPKVVRTPSKRAQDFQVRNAEAYVRKVNENGDIVMGATGSYRYADEITQAFYNSGDQKLQIFGAFYEFYNHVFNWLNGQDDFGVNGIAALVKGINENNTVLNDYLYDHLEYKEHLWRDYAKKMYGVDFMNYRNRGDKDWVLKRSDGGPTRPEKPVWDPDERIDKVEKLANKYWFDPTARKEEDRQITNAMIKYKLGKKYSTDIKRPSNGLLKSVFNALAGADPDTEYHFTQSKKNLDPVETEEHIDPIVKTLEGLEKIENTKEGSSIRSFFLQGKRLRHRMEVRQKEQPEDTSTETYSNIFYKGRDFIEGNEEKLVHKKEITVPKVSDIVKNLAFAALSLSPYYLVGKLAFDLVRKEIAKNKEDEPDIELETTLDSDTGIVDEHYSYLKERGKSKTTYNFHNSRDIYLFEAEKTLTPYSSARDNKIEAMIDKNDLLYQLWNNWAWYEKSIPVEA